MDWFSCSVPQQQIKNAWDEAMDIAYVSSGKIDWASWAAKDFLGGEDKTDYHSDIKGNVKIR